MDLDLAITNIGVHLIVKDADKNLLVLKRTDTDKNEPNCWDLPGGDINKSEDLISGIKREVLEETNLKIGNINIIGGYTCDQGKLQLCAVTSLNEATKVMVSQEHSEYRWINLDDFLELIPESLHLKAAKYFINFNEKLVSYNILNK